MGALVRAALLPAGALRAGHDAGAGCRVSVQELPQPLRGAVVDAAAAWDAQSSTGRLWARDAALWTGTDEARWLGWLTAPDDAAATVGSLNAFAAEIRGESMSDLDLEQRAREMQVDAELRAMNERLGKE